jgi:hypothetical protein
MLAYLDALCAALLAHNALEVRRLLQHPLSRILPRDVREEALAISRDPHASLRAPLRTLQFYHQTAELLSEEPESSLTGPQLELPFDRRADAYETSLTLARASVAPVTRRRSARAP